MEDWWWFRQSQSDLNRKPPKMNETTKRGISSTQSCKRPSGDPATGGTFHILGSWNHGSVWEWDIPSGKRLHNYGKIHHFQWENPLFQWPCSIFNSFLYVYQRVHDIPPEFYGAIIDGFRGENEPNPSRGYPTFPQALFVTLIKHGCQLNSLIKWAISQWIGLRENLQETIDFPIKYGAFL